jgi:hypothetical protein
MLLAEQSRRGVLRMGGAALGTLASARRAMTAIRIERKAL